MGMSNESDERAGILAQAGSRGSRLRSMRVLTATAGTASRPSRGSVVPVPDSRLGEMKVEPSALVVDADIHPDERIGRLPHRPADGEGCFGRNLKDGDLRAIRRKKPGKPPRPHGKADDTVVGGIMNILGHLERALEIVAGPFEVQWRSIIAAYHDIAEPEELGIDVIRLL